MSLQNTLGRTVTLLISATLIAGGTTALASEQRCDELGANCVCSEPMNANEGGRLNDGHNFSDSPPATDCSRHAGSNMWQSSAISTSVTERGMPAGNAVDWVVETDYAPAGQIVWMRGRGPAAPGDARVCMRFYMQVTNDWTGSIVTNGTGCPTERNKVMQIQYGDGSFYQMQPILTGECTGPPGSGRAAYKPFGSTQSKLNNRDLRPNLTWADCFEGEGWCRVEACAHGDLQNGSNISIDSRVTALSTGVTSEVINHGPVSASGGLREFGLDLYHGQGPGPHSGKRYLSHVMQAAWSSNNGQWIGAAHEVEGGDGGGGGGGGGGGSTPPPEPSPQPPAAPVMLQPSGGSGTGGTATSGGETLTVTSTVSGGNVQVTSAVTGGQGGYNFLTDCGNDGNWNGVDNTSSSVSSYTCSFSSSGTHEINVLLWDEGTSVSLNVPFQATTQ